MYATATVLQAAPLLLLFLLFGRGWIVLAAGYLLIFLLCIGGGLGWAALATLLTSESTAGYGTTMSINACLQMTGGALGAGIGGLLLAVGGWPALGIGLASFSALSAFLGWRSPARLP